MLPLGEHDSLLVMLILETLTHSNRRMLMFARGYLNTCQRSRCITELTWEVFFIMDLLLQRWEAKAFPTAATYLHVFISKEVFCFLSLGAGFWRRGRQQRVQTKYEAGRLEMKDLVEMQPSQEKKKVA